MWPVPTKLEAQHLRGCELLESRDVMLESLPKNSVCAEVGIDKSEFSAKILQATHPSKLHLIDYSPWSIQNAKKKFVQEVAQGTIETHLGDSGKLLQSFPNEYFDWVYIDGDHSYEGAKRDLEATLQKLKPAGLIALNDYIYFGSIDLVKYGVIEAVNEFCITHGFKLVFFALHSRMHNDVVLQRI